MKASFLFCSSFSFLWWHLNCMFVLLFNFYWQYCRCLPFLPTLPSQEAPAPPPLLSVSMGYTYTSYIYVLRLISPWKVLATFLDSPCSSRKSEAVPVQNNVRFWSSSCQFSDLRILKQQWLILRIFPTSFLLRIFIIVLGKRCIFRKKCKA